MKILIYDIETFLEFFLIKVYDIQENKMYTFKVNKWENNLSSFINFIDSRKEYYWVGFNSLRFDAQVTEWVIRNYDKW